MAKVLIEVSVTGRHQRVPPSSGSPNRYLYSWHIAIFGMVYTPLLGRSRRNVLESSTLQLRRCPRTCTRLSTRLPSRHLLLRLRRRSKIRPHRSRYRPKKHSLKSKKASIIVTNQLQGYLSFVFGYRIVKSCV